MARIQVLPLPNVGELTPFVLVIDQLDPEHLDSLKNLGAIKDQIGAAGIICTEYPLDVAT